MSNPKLTVIGGGQMGRALVSGMLASKVLVAEQITVVEPAAESRAWWQQHQPQVRLADLSEAVATTDLVLLAVKPHLIGSITTGQGALWKDKLVISIAAGINLDDLCGWIEHRRVVRVMPNTPSLVGAGASAFSCADQVSDQDRELISRMLESVGLAVEVDESQMDAVTGLSGSGPAYMCLVLEAMADGAVMAGLPRKLAMQLAAQTMLGTARMIAETGRHPGELKDAVTSPGGTTIAALSTLEQNGLRGALMQAVMASAQKSRELGTR